MPAKRPEGGETVQFSVTISRQAASMIEQLISVGLHGTSRGEVARTLIHGRLEQLFTAGMVDGGKAQDT